MTAPVINHLGHPIGNVRDRTEAGTDGDDVRINGFGNEPIGGTGDFARPSGEVWIDGAQFSGFASVLERQDADDGSVEPLRVKDCQISETTSLAINLEVPVADYWISGNEFEDVTQLAIRIGRNSFDDQDTWEKGHVRSNNISDVNAASSGDTGGVLVYGKETEIVGNVIEDVDGNATGEAWGIYTKCRYGSIAFNVIRDVQAQTESAWGINVKGQSRNGSGSPQGFATRVIGNHVENVVGNTTGGYGIRLQTDSALALGNTVEDCGNAGVALDYSEDVSGLYNLQALGNIIRFTTAGSTVGVRIGTSVSSTDTSHNLIDGALIGLRFVAIRGDEVGWSAIGNVIRVDGSSGQGILVRRDEDLDNLSLVNNVVAAGSVGLRFETGTGVLSNVRVLDNQFAGTTTHISGTIPADIELRHCWKFQTTAAGPTSALTLALSDAAVYDVELKAIAILDGDATEVASYHKKATVYRDGGNATLLGGADQDVVTDQEVTSAWDAALTVSGNNLLVSLTGEASHTIKWKLWIHVIGIPA